MWKIYAILSAFFAALTAILCKLGVKNIDSNIAMGIRTVIILFLIWGIIAASNSFGYLKSISVKNFLFLIASGITTGLSWLFYFKAIQLGDISKVAPIDKLSLVLTIILGVVILKETLTFPVIVGGMLIIIGVLVLFFLA